MGPRPRQRLVQRLNHHINNNVFFGISSSRRPHRAKSRRQRRTRRRLLDQLKFKKNKMIPASCKYARCRLQNTPSH